MWNCEEGVQAAKVSGRFVFLYRLEIMMVKDAFTLESEKSRMNPYVPLLGFPNKMNEDY